LLLTSFFPPPLPQHTQNSYSDFVVNEIDGRGKVVLLRRIGHASAAAADAAAAEAAARADASAVEVALSSKGGGGAARETSNGAPASTSSSSSSLETLFANLVALTSEEDAAMVREFLDSLTSRGDGGNGEGQNKNQNQNQKRLVLSPSSDKASRGAVHAWFREAARALGAGLASKGSLETTTTTTVTSSEGGGAGSGGGQPSSSLSSSVCVVFTPGRSGGGGGRGNGGRGGRVGGSNSNKRGRDGEGGGGGGNRTGSRQRPPLPGAFCHFTLEKTNLDTAAALQEIALRCYGGGGGGGGNRGVGRGGGRGRGNDSRRPVSSSALSVAGTKDKRGVTTQRVSARRTAARRLAAAAAGVRGVRVGDFAYEDEGLRLGDGRGNRFTVALRGLKAPEGSEEKEGKAETESSSALAAAAAAAAFGARGFVNYFGRQRFGVGGGAAPTHVVGALLARGEWEEAARAIMSPRGGGGGGGGGGNDGDEKSAGNTTRNNNNFPHSSSRHEAEDAARRAWLRGECLDHRRTLRSLPRGAVAERALLASLADAEERDSPPKPLSSLSPGARAARFSAALSRVPRNLRTMYIHALQSRLWNAAASARVRESRGGGSEGEGGGSGFGAEAGVIEGDVILVSEEEEASDDGDNDDEDNAEDSALAADDEGDNNDEEQQPEKEKEKTTTTTTSTSSKKRLPPAVRLATREDRGLPLTRVVLPMLAPGILLPANSSGDALRRAARELGVDAGTCGAAAAPAENGKCGDKGEIAATKSHLGLAAAAGGYRRLLASPSRVRHCFVAHSCPDDDLPMGELFGEDEDEEGGGREETAAKKKPKPSSSTSSSSVELWEPGQPLPPGKGHLALLLRFRLPRSSYATMAVRELTKRPGWDSGSAGGGGGGAAVVRREVEEEEAKKEKREEKEAKEGGEEAGVEVEEAAAAAAPVPAAPAVPAPPAPPKAE